MLFIIANKILLASVALSTPKSMKRSSILGGNTKYWKDIKEPDFKKSHIDVTILWRESNYIKDVLKFPPKLAGHGGVHL